MSIIKIVACFWGSQKEFSFEKSLLFTFVKTLKPKDNFLLKAFLQHKEQEPNKNILNSQHYNMPFF
jgi:hypothetical protein